MEVQGSMPEVALHSGSWKLGHVDPSCWFMQMASPMAGSFYRSPAPGEAAFCKEGDKVSKGQTVCIIEAMKLMNEIEVTYRGIEFGQVKGSKPPGRPRKIWNDIVLSDFQQLNIIRPYRDAQNKSAWRDRTWATHT